MKNAKVSAILNSIHRAAHQALATAGFRFQVRREGDMQLGLWRCRFTKPPYSRHPLKRFVLMPGLGDTPLSWLVPIVMSMPALKRNYDEAILFDFPGFHGRLSNEKCYPSMDQLLRTVNDTFDSLRPHTIFGHSLGGWIAAHYAVQCGLGSRPRHRPGTYTGPETLILANPSGVGGDEEMREQWSSLFYKAMEEGFHVLRGHMFAREPIWFPLIVSEFQNFIAREDSREFLRSIRADHLIQDRLGKIRSRVWLLWGEKDTMAPVRWMEAWLKELAADTQNADKVTGILIKGVGHSPHLEKPAITASILSQIVAGRQPHKTRSRFWQVIEPGEPVKPRKPKESGVALDDLAA